MIEGKKENENKYKKKRKRYKTNNQPKIVNCGTRTPTKNGVS